MTAEVPLSLAWLQVEKAIGRRPELSGEALDMREQYRLLEDAASPGHKINTNVRAEDVAVNSHITVRIYRPESPLHPSLPVGVYFHGGGFCGGNLDSEDYFCRVLSEQLPSVIVSVDYRLAPEHKSPIQVEDCVEAWNWAYRNSSLLNGNRSKYFTVGQSAGGTLALAVANRLVCTGRENEINGVASIVPLAIHPANVPAKHKHAYQTFSRNAYAPVLTAKALNTVLDAMSADPRDPNLFVLLSPHLSKFPPTYIVVCGADPVRDDGYLMYTSLKQAGIQTKIDEYAELPHAFWAFDCQPDKGNFIDDVLAGIKFAVRI